MYTYVEMSIVIMMHAYFTTFSWGVSFKYHFLNGALPSTTLGRESFFILQVEYSNHFAVGTTIPPSK